MAGDWKIILTPEVDAWLAELRVNDANTYFLVLQALRVLAVEGPALGRPLVDRLAGSALGHLKELRPGSSARTEVRILFIFDPWRRAVLLVAGDKAGNWKRWYRVAIAKAEQRYAAYLEDREGDEKYRRHS